MSGAPDRARVSPWWILCVSGLFLAGGAGGCRDGGVSGPEGPGRLRFSSEPISHVHHNDTYGYSPTVEGGAGPLTFRAEQVPSWLEFDAESHGLSGEPTADHLGTHAVRITVSDSMRTVSQSFSIEVSLRQVGSGSWVGSFPHPWAHDGVPVIGEEVDLYSDASSDEVKLAMHERAQAAFTEIKSLMSIEDHSVFFFPAGRSKVDIYANRLNPEYFGGFAYHGGAIVLSYDHPGYLPGQAWCANEIEHETLHVVETLLEGSGILGADVWFREGIADYYAGNDLLGSIPEMNSWLETRRHLPGGGNPIRIHRWEDFPPEVTAVRGQGLWYPMFELAVRYLMHPQGLGRSYGNVRDLFVVLGGDQNRFQEAFEDHMGISLSEFEGSFFERIQGFLMGLPDIQAIPTEGISPNREPS